MPDLNALTRANAARWAKVRLTRDFTHMAKRLVNLAAKARYQEIAKATGVPWFIIAVIHEREASQAWDRQLAQGDLLNRVSIHVPKGRGPFFDHPDDPPSQDAFYRAALDALIDCPPYASRWKDWSAGGAMTLLEKYNGLGYANRGRPSPYIWAGTDQYKKGKYVRDGIYDPDVVDLQPGSAGLLITMMRLDPTITFDEAKIRPVPKPPPEPPGPQPVPSIMPTPRPLPITPVTASAKGPSLGAFFIGLFRALSKVLWRRA